MVGVAAATAASAATAAAGGSNGPCVSEICLLRLGLVSTVRPHSPHSNPLDLERAISGCYG